MTENTKDLRTPSTRIMLKITNETLKSLLSNYTHYTGMNLNDLADRLPSSLQSYSTNFEGVT